MFFLLPIFALLLKLLYRSTQRLYVEHLIFSLHFYTFIFLLLTVVTLIDQEFINSASPLIILGYLFIALKSVYGQGWLKTLGKLGLLSVSYFTVLILVLMITLLLTALVTAALG